MNDSDEIIRKYSPEVMQRLLGHLKPYKIAVVITLISLILATTAELYSPIVIRRALDNHLLRREYRLNLDFLIPEMSPVLATDDMRQNGVQIGSSLFISADYLKNWSNRTRQIARESHLLDEQDWYVFERGEEEAEALVNQYPNLFLSSSTHHAIRISDRKTLSAKEQVLIRSYDISGLKQHVGLYLALLVLILIFTFGQVYVASWIAQKIMADIRTGLLTHIISQSMSYLNRTPVGSLVSRTANDVETIAEFFTNVTISFLKDFAMMVGVIGVMFALDVNLAWISLTTLVPTFFIIVIFQDRMREAFRRVRSRVSAVNTFLSERISGMYTVQLFDTEKRSDEEFSQKGENLLDAEMSQIRIMAVFRPLIELIASVAIALIIWYSSNLHESGLVSLGILIAFAELIQKFFQPVKDIAEKFNIFQSAMAGGERIFAMMDDVDRIPEVLETQDYDTKQNKSSSKKTKKMADSYNQIVFEDVHFSYIAGEPVLKGLNFTIPKGSTTAIVGTTGAGKTTIANLLTRLWDPQEGRILLDGSDIRERSLEELRQSIQPISQDVFLFSGSIANNIDLGMGFSEERIEQATKLARADNFIRKLPDGYNTEVSEGASNFSAGQRQLIAFARIIAYNPRIIILDEATANVDTETETLLQEGLNSLLQDRTAMIIAHRLSTIRRADHILVLGRGRLQEYGTHEELMKQNGIYRNLYELQFAETH